MVEVCSRQPTMAETDDVRLQSVGHGCSKTVESSGSKTDDGSGFNVEEIPITDSDASGRHQQQTTNCIENMIVKLENNDNQPTVEYELDEESFNDNDLPVGWKRLNHHSGMPVYLNEEMKVCTFAKPYFLGVNSLKNHEIPVENVPCLARKLKLQKDNNEIDECLTTLSHEQYREYCSKIFNFKSIKFMRFSSWDKRREYIRMVKADRRRKDLPKLVDKSQLMSFPVPQLSATNRSLNNCNSSTPGDHWVINLNGKSYVSILHEYIQRVLKTQPSYEFKELENARYPYLATVILDGMQYGVGIGSSKKQAKLDAARATLEILLPSVKNHIQVNRRHAMNDRQGSNNFQGDELFDKLTIKDSRIPEFCSQAAESMPYDMLQTCVKRNFGNDVNVKCDMQGMQSGFDSTVFYRCTMSVDRYTATVICKNKREGRHKGAQALLQVMHPHIHYFGSLLRLYSDQHFGNGCEKKLDEPGHQSPTPRSGPNNKILRKLRETMLKLEEKKKRNEFHS